MSHRRRRFKAGKSRGQSMVEMALITPVLLVLIIIALDGGRAMWAYMQIGQMAQQGAQYGSIQPTDTAGIQAAALGGDGEINGITPVVTSTTGSDTFVVPGSASTFQFVRVTVTYQFEPIFDFPPMPDSITLRREVEMRIINS